MKFFKIAIFLAVGVFFSSSVHAFTVFDTGTPVGNTLYSLSANQWLTGQFEVDERLTISSVEGYFLKNFVGTRYLTLLLYANGAQLPSATYASRRFSMDSSEVGSSWEGVSDLDWLVNPGTYWVSFEVRANDDFEGAMLSGAPNAAANYAYRSGGSWHAYDPLGFGFRVEGTTGIGAVPEPMSLILFGLGAVGAFIKRRFV